MSGTGGGVDDEDPGNQPDGPYDHLFPINPQPGLFGGQYAEMMANARGMTGMGMAALGMSPDVSTAGTGLPPSLALAPTLPQRSGAISGSAPTLSDHGTGKLDIDKFVTAMDRNALPQSKGICATNSRQGLEAGGIDTTGHPVDAKDYGPFLVARGAAAVSSDDYAPQAGDIAVFECTGQHKYGHIQVFDGKQWVSDFKQSSYSPYREKASTPPSTVYRFPAN